MERQKLDTIRMWDEGYGALARRPRLLHELFQIPQIGKEERLLDIGCGMGYYLQPLDCFKVGVDISMRNLREALSVDHEADFLLCDAERLPFRDGFFTKISLVEVIHHLPDFARVMQEAWRVLRPGGELLIEDHNHEGHLPIYPLVRLAYALSHIRGEGHHAESTGISVTRGLTTLSRIGFSIEEVCSKGSFMWILLGYYNWLTGRAGESLYTTKRAGLFGRIVERLDPILSRRLPPRLLVWFRLRASKPPAESYRRTAKIRHHHY